MKSLKINNTNPKIYGLENENEIDKLIREIDLGNAKILNEKAIEILKGLIEK